MDLSLFDVFDETDTGAEPVEAKTNMRAPKRARSEEENLEKSQDEKNDRTESGNQVEEGDNEEEEIEQPITVFTEHTEHDSNRSSTLTTILALPADYVPTEAAAVVPSSEPAKIYPFPLDTFQKEAIQCIEKNESVLVAAHTSAGKTVCAEYAIAKSLKAKQRVIYTSPIKALSNQKYRDMQAEFGDVGLMTGDMTINPTATCLIMTTEILRNMLYRGSEVMREVAWVIYDEVHYMRDKERGVVWEESIILLPHKVRFVFLSATIPNAKEFVGWVAKTHHQPCHVVYTDYRPVPLQHFIFPSASEGLYLVVDEKGKFREDNFQRAMTSLHPPNEMDTEKGKKKRKSNQGAESDLFKIIRLIMERELDPCIVFSFSKKECETYALQMSRLDFNSDDEKMLIEQVFMNAIEALSDDDRRLPQVETLLPLLKKGVGIHHGGLLPILKEIIEILFQEGLIKCLFATETFSIGINMPAKTVVFTSTRKFDGEDFRWITSGEYIQMSGRAGRRGKDDRGIVIQMIDEKMEPDIAKGMLYGDPDPLYSSYHVSYNMVLNMMRVEDADPEHILRASFYQYQREQKAPELDRQAHELHHSALTLHIPHEEQVAEYTLLLKQLERTQAELETLLFQPKYCLPFLQPGRVITLTVKSGSLGSLTISPSSGSSSCASSASAPTIKPLSWGQGVIVNCRKMDGKNAGNVGNTLSEDVESVLGKETEDEKLEHVMDVLVEAVRIPNSLQLSCHLTGLSGASYLPHAIYESLRSEAISSAASGSGSSSVLPSLPSEYLILQFTLTTLSSITAIRLNLPKDLRKKQSIQNCAKALQEVKRRFATQSLPLLDPKEDLKINDDGGLYDVLLGRSLELQNRMTSSEFNRLDLTSAAATVSGESNGGNGSKRSSKKAKVTETSAAGGAAAAGGATGAAEGGGVVSLLNKETLLSLYETKQGLLLQSKHFHQLANETKAILMKSELKNMKRLLKRLHFISRENEVLEVKGRFSCEINTSDEVLLTDMVFEGIFNTLSVETTVSLLSCFVYNEPIKTSSSSSSGGGRGGAAGGGGGGAAAITSAGSASTSSASMSNSAASVTATSGFTKLRPEYQSLVKSLHNLAIKLYSYRSEYKLNTVAEEAYLASFNFSLMEVISLWCSGGKFIDICRLTDVYEGTIIRVIRRLEELLRQLITASMMIGNMELKAKFEEGADRIRRGIIFTSSLYL